MAFMGWSAEKRGGAWYATKIMDRGGYGASGAVLIRKRLSHLPATATKREAEREIVRMYRARVLN